jgi:hypothetical protein
MNRSFSEAAVFWDIQSSGIKSPNLIMKFVQNIRKVFKGKLLKFQAYGDSSLLEKNVRESLFAATVPLIDVPSKGNLDHQLEMTILLDLSLYLFDEVKNENITVIFVTNNENMVQMTNKLKYRKNFHSVLILSSGKELTQDENLICDNVLTFSQFNSFPESYLVSNSDIESEEDLVKFDSTWSETPSEIQNSFDDALEQLYEGIFDPKESIEESAFKSTFQAPPEKEKETKKDYEQEAKKDFSSSQVTDESMIEHLKKFLENSKKETKSAAFRILTKDEKIYLKNNYQSLHYFLVKYPVIFHTTKDYVSLSNDDEVESKILKKTYDLASKEEWTNRGMNYSCQRFRLCF